MNHGIAVKRPFHVRQGRHRRRRAHAETKPSVTSHIPRISRLMALAIQFDELVRNNATVDQAKLARLGHVSRARLTQIMNLLNLTAEIQEALLFKSAGTRNRDAISERNIRPIAAVLDWRLQKKAWSELLAAINE